MATTIPFNLATHELPPFAICEAEGFADAVFEVEWNGQVAEVMARCIHTLHPEKHLLLSSLLFRFAGDVASRIVSNSVHIRAWQFPSSYNPLDIASSVQQALRCGRWGFAFRVDTRELGGAGICWLYLHSDGIRGSWGGFIGAEHFSHFRVEPNFRSFSDALADPDSDVRFALEWLQVPFRVQLLLAVSFTRGNLEELTEVITAIARYEEAAQHHRCLSYRNQFFYLNLGFCTTPPISESLQKWDFYIQNYFGIHPNEEFATQHDCVLFIAPQIYVKRVPLSQHDRFEAMLFLLDWAKDKMPIDELLSLFPTL